MLFPTTGTHELVRQERLKDCLRKADMDCICKAAGIDQRGWAGRQFCRVAVAIGTILVAAGQRLKGAGAAQQPGSSSLQQAR
ncbi:MAG: hypothetical protein U9R25_14940 [Chloroflexota bacterium]|nr:hypothetical protein [Chloroflexota bacterium]